MLYVTTTFPRTFNPTIWCAGFLVVLMFSGFVRAGECSSRSWSNPDWALNYIRKVYSSGFWQSCIHTRDLFPTIVRQSVPMGDISCSLFNRKSSRILLIFLNPFFFKISNFRRKKVLLVFGLFGYSLSNESSIVSLPFCWSFNAKIE